jgi:hypothetical protein
MISPFWESRKAIMDEARALCVVGRDGVEVEWMPLEQVIWGTVGAEEVYRGEEVGLEELSLG